MASGRPSYREPVKILINLAALRQVRWYEHFTRFLLGGLISVVAGLIAKAFGPTIGGLLKPVFR